MPKELTTINNHGIEVSEVFKFFTGIIVVVIIADVMSRFINPTNILIAQYIRSQSYIGVSDPRIIEVNSELSYLDLINEHPYTPWVSVSFVNDGLSSAFIAINQPTALHELKAGETASVYRIGAQERISSIFFKCNTGEETSMRVIGEY